MHLVCPGCLQIYRASSETHGDAMGIRERDQFEERINKKCHSDRSEMQQRAVPRNCKDEILHRRTGASLDVLARTRVAFLRDVVRHFKLARVAS